MASTHTFEVVCPVTGTVYGTRRTYEGAFSLSRKFVGSVIRMTA